MRVNLCLACSKPTGTPGIIRAHADEQDTDEEIERMVRLRIERQTLLTRRTSPPLLRLVLNEAVLLRSVGGRSAMAEQWARADVFHERQAIVSGVADGEFDA
ncbi:Scr1 family TA system antitoxin-like transcriptional regulator [Streptomyces sp. NPDC001922]|uniref:Scr1 family TA system antitoxin-like transcriptional regulator n=1 Tax=Streptomyces sp. NPDC001922 TaxID=3364624 RepID=UPI0036A82EC7